jgi:hypothetical protein
MMFAYVDASNGSMWISSTKDESASSHGFLEFEVDDHAAAWDYYFNGEAVVPYSKSQLEKKSNQPSPFHIWSNQIMDWEETRVLSNFQDEKWEQIKLDRASHETGTFQWNGHTIDADMARLNGAATSVMIAQAAGYTYSDVWTLADNTTIPVTGQDIFAMGLALAAHVSACHARGRALRQLIYSCSTKEEVEAITWETAV